MTKLYLYTAFHFNLAFSSIPQEQYANVIDTCYWPVVELLDRFNYIRLGFEFTGDTLEKINQVDYTLIQKLKQDEALGRCEIIGAGMSQAIFPLIPELANRKNLEQGNRIYEKYFGKRPETVYVNEQTFSNGLVDLYEAAGCKNLVMEYENSKLFNNFEESDKYFSHRLGRLNLVWNSSINFQKFQRYTSGTDSLEEYMVYILSNYSGTEDRAFLLYGSDTEIFDYKPGNFDAKFKGYASKEMERLYRLFEAIEGDERLELVTPSYVANHLNTGKSLVLGTAEYPVVCKKQPKYNVVRWAVSGREDTKMNTECTKILKKICTLENLGCPLKDEIFYDLSLLWGSDYRTKTTESKVSEFYYLLGKLQQQLSEKERLTLGRYPIRDDFAVINPNREAWKDGASFEFEVNFNKQELYENRFEIELEGRKAIYQLDDVEHFRDGSIRRCKLIIMFPGIEAGQVLQGRFIRHEGETPQGIGEKGFRIKTGTVDVQFSRTKKGTIEKLYFPGISSTHAIGLIPHGFYDDIRHSLDLFSGHTIIRDRSLRQITDLDNSDMLLSDTPCRLRIPVRSKISGSFGELWKVFYIYQYENRVDIEYNFRFKDLNPIFFRTGILTFNPEFFTSGSLAYSTVNGGSEENYPLRGKSFDQSEQISLDISANGCLGATNGWVDFHDDRKGILVYHDNSELYGIPMLTYKEIGSSSLLRLQHAISETDDTGSIFWRGHSRFKMSIFGYKSGDRKHTITHAENNNLGLILLQRGKSSE